MAASFPSKGMYSHDRVGAFVEEGPRRGDVEQSRKVEINQETGLAQTWGR